MQVRPIQALRPSPEKAARVAVPPYDVVSRQEAKAYATGNPDCFFHVTRAEIDLPDTVDPYSDQVYARAAANFAAFRARGVFLEDREPAFYIYRLEDRDHVQCGVMLLCNVDDYRSNRIRKHEKTRAIPETDRTKHIAAVKAHTGPVLLAYRPVATIRELMRRVSQASPLYDFVAPDGVHHTLWRSVETRDWIEAFHEVPTFYIADGHHRAAAAARYAEERRRQLGGALEPDAEYNWFLALACAADELRILPYHRVVKDWGDWTLDEFLAAIRDEFVVEECTDPMPVRPGQAGLLLPGKRLRLSWDVPSTADPARALDVAVLQDRLLGPLLNIEDPRNDPRLDFVSGAHSLAELERLVSSGSAMAVFLMYPTSIETLMMIADLGGTMPPKSTWFSPKPFSGLIVHVIE